MAPSYAKDSGKGEILFLTAGGLIGLSQKTDFVTGVLDKKASLYQEAS
jgi:hypothetical protein